MQSGLRRNFACGFLTDIHTAAALVLVGIESHFVQPARCVHGGFKPCIGERLRVAGGAEFNFHVHFSFSPISCSQRGASTVALNPASANDCALPAGPNLISMFISPSGAANEGTFQQVIACANPEITAVDGLDVTGQSAQTVAAQRIGVNLVTNDRDL